MALNPSQQPMHDEGPTKMSVSSSKYTSQYTVAPLGADPELLRWRAEVLLDEMMLGGVDVAAGDGASGAWPAVATPSPSSATYAEQDEGGFGAPALLEEEWGRTEDPLLAQSDNNGLNGGLGAGYYGRNGHRHEGETTSDAESISTADRKSHPEQSVQSSPLVVQPDISVDGSEVVSDPAQNRSNIRPPLATNTTGVNSTGTGAAAVVQPKTQGWVASAEERYRQLARREVEEPPDLSIAHSAAPVTGNMGDYAWPDAPAAAATASTGQAANTLADESASRRRATQISTGSGTRAAASLKRSNLLPRMSTADVEAIQREIYTLQNAVDAKLPVGHESNTRAHHLLEKANEILQADAARSAEVEYYLQQVRTIFQRVQQTIDGSSVYRNRLLVYLLSWILLADIVLASYYLYPAELAQRLANGFAVAVGSFTMQHLFLSLIAIFAGALGGACSVLISLQRQRHLPHGFIDRKFGLRGLLLPLMGGIVGMLLAFVVSLFYALMGVQADQNLLWATLPLLLAALFGISQDSIYGTNE